MTVNKKSMADTGGCGMNDIVTTEDATPIGRLMTAVQSGSMEPDALKALVDAVKYFDDRQAEKDFNASLVAAQSEFPRIVREQSGYNEQYKFARLEDIDRVIKPILFKHGLTYRHEGGQREELAYIKCVVSHINGHSVEYPVTFMPETSGNKNAVQAVGSAMTYYRRYTLTALLGIVTSDDIDDDGRGAIQVKTITEDQARKLEALCDDLEYNKQIIYDSFSIESLDDLPETELSRVMIGVKKKGKKS